MNAVTAARTAEAATAEELDEARHWVRDVVADPEAVTAADPASLVLYVDRQYEGGWASFLAETPSGAA
jgi:hypothetical protein